MDERRLQELEAKRFSGGLSREEADELGRLMAEREGRPYSNADDRTHPDSLTQSDPAGHPDLQEAEEEKAS